MNCFLPFIFFELFPAFSELDKYYQAGANKGRADIFVFLRGKLVIRWRCYYMTRMEMESELTGPATTVCWLRVPVHAKTKVYVGPTCWSR
jgi:hypothetical protein